MNLRFARSLSPREYHARRKAERLEAVERRRTEKLAATREAVRRIAPRYPAVRSVHLFGSLLRPGEFHQRSDIDLAIGCSELDSKAPFARALEAELGVAIDLRPLCGVLAETVAEGGEKIYG